MVNFNAPISILITKLQFYPSILLFKGSSGTVPSFLNFTPLFYFYFIKTNTHHAKMKFTASFVVSCLVASSVALTTPIEARQRNKRNGGVIPCKASEGCRPAELQGRGDDVVLRPIEAREADDADVLVAR